MSFYKKSENMLLRGYDPETDPSKKTIGVPFVLMIHKLFPVVNAYFRNLGFNVVLSDPTDEETIAASQRTARGETCYPVKLIYGHMLQLAEKKVDYIFVPSIHTMKHEHTKVAHNYGCVYMQTAPKLIFDALHLDKEGIKLLNPVFDLDMGQMAMASAMISAGAALGKPKPVCMMALKKASEVFKKFNHDVEEEGRKFLENLKPDEKVLVLITRNYGIGDPVLNMGIPELLLERGYKVLTLSHLPAHDFDISDEYPNLYWPFGQHIISGAKIVAHHPNLYAVYLTNHGCGPDTMLSHLFRREMEGKPYLQIEVDEHFSKVGVITRIEAFMNSLEQHPAERLPEDFDLRAIAVRKTEVRETPLPGVPLHVPYMGVFGAFIAEYYRRVYGADVKMQPPVGAEVLSSGRAETSSKEYLPFAAKLGEALSLSGKSVQYLIPQSEGSDADGMYAETVSCVLANKGISGPVIVSPMLERIYENAKDPELLFRAALTGDVLMAAPRKMREEMLSELSGKIPEWEELKALAGRAGEEKAHEKRLLLAGLPENIYSLNEKIPETLENEGWDIAYAPLAEFLLMLWTDAEEADRKQGEPLPVALLPRKSRIPGILGKELREISELLKRRSSFSADFDALLKNADRVLPGFAGAGGRYRHAKAEMAEGFAAVITVCPRYENTELVLELAERQGAVPVYHIALDNDFDEASWSHLRSFLYYV